MPIASLAAASVVATATLLAPVPVVAAGDPAPVVRVHDPAGDVWTFSNSSTGYRRAVQPAADVLSARIAVGRYALVVRMVFDDLQRVDTQWYWCDVRTPGNPTARFVLEAVQGRWRGRFYQEVDGEWVHVPGLAHHVDYTSDTVMMVIPWQLLGNPGSLRVRLHNELGLPDHDTFFTDNPTSTSPHPRFTADLARP